MDNDNQAPTTLPLTDEEQNFSLALGRFFQSLETLAMTQKQLTAAGGDAFRAFSASLPPESRELAAAQWPQISMLLSSLPMLGL
jgi:hypothetical protein